MLALFHMIFILIKIGIQSLFYSAIFLISTLLLPKDFEIRKRFIGQKFNSWLKLAIVIGLILFLFSRTHWGSHGLGDFSRIPLKYGQVVNNSVGTYFRTNPKDVFSSVDIYDFVIYENYICAETNEDGFLVFNIKTSTLKIFETKQDYENYAIQNSLPKIKEFKDFSYYYKKYWGGWRFFLLP